MIKENIGKNYSGKDHLNTVLTANAKCYTPNTLNSSS